MVKGVSRQVIVVHTPGEELFDQAIYILKDGAVAKGVTEEMLLKQAQSAISGRPRRRLRNSGPVWAAGGALATGLVWLLSHML